MSESAGKRKIYFKATSAAHVDADEIKGVLECTISGAPEYADANYIGGAGVKDRELSIYDFTISLSGHYKKANAPMALMETLSKSGVAGYFTRLTDPDALSGSQGHDFKVKVTAYEEGNPGADLVSFSATLSAAGELPVAV